MRGEVGPIIRLYLLCTSACYLSKAFACHVAVEIFFNWCMMSVGDIKFTFPKTSVH